MRGYAGRTLYVNLSTNEIKDKPVTDEMRTLFTGGKGFDLKLLERALKGLDNSQVQWSYTAPVSASVFRTIEEKNGSLTLLMPIRLKEEEVNHEPERGD